MVACLSSRFDTWHHKYIRKRGEGEENRPRKKRSSQTEFYLVGEICTFALGSMVYNYQLEREGNITTSLITMQEGPIGH